MICRFGLEKIHMHYLTALFMSAVLKWILINILEENTMADQFLLPMARSIETGETVKTQDLTGARFTTKQRALAEDVANQIATKMSARTGQNWIGFVRAYTPTSRS
jgi:hypothetical protein